MGRGRMGETLRSLGLALLNATLMLVLLCLILGYMVSREVSAISSNLSESLGAAAGVREEIREMTGELALLRAEVAEVRSGGVAGGQGVAERVDARLEAVGARIDGASARLEALAANPGDLVDRAIEATARQVTKGIADLRQCSLPAGS